MASNTDGEAKGCTFQWKIKNFSHLWWVKNGVLIESPSFIAAGLEDTKWSLRLYPMGHITKNTELLLYRNNCCSGPDLIRVNFKFEFLGKNDLILKEEWSEDFPKGGFDGWEEIEAIKRVFITEKEKFLLEDTMTIQCTMWMSETKPVKSNHLFAITDIKLKRRSFIWKIDQTSALESKMRNEFKDYLIGFDLVINDFKTLNINITSFPESVKYISCNTSITYLEGRKEMFGNNKFFANDLNEMVSPCSAILNFPELIRNKSIFFPNDIFSLDFEFVLSTFEHFDNTMNLATMESEVAGKEESQNIAVPTDDLCPAKAIEILVEANNLSNDSGQKIAMEDYILGQHKQFFCSQEWENFMKAHLELAANIMHRKITKT